MTFSGPDAHKVTLMYNLIFVLSLILASINLCQCDTAPNINYSHNMRILKVPFGTPVGTLIYRLKGSDPDGDALTFGSVDQIGSSLLYFQSVSFTEADVYLKSPLTVSDVFLTTCLPLVFIVIYFEGHLLLLLLFVVDVIIIIAFTAFYFDHLPICSFVLVY